MRAPRSPPADEAVQAVQADHVGLDVRLHSGLAPECEGRGSEGSSV